MTINKNFKNIDSEFNFKIVQHITTLSTSNTGWTKEINLVCFNGKNPKIDIRDWNSDHSKMSRGISLTKEEFLALQKSINGIKKEILEQV